MNALIIDDKSTLRENLKLILNIYLPDIEVIGEADGVQSGLSLLKSHSPDIVFLDIEMNDGTGFDLLSLYGKIDFKLIFVSGHEEFALKAFKFSAIDYLVKPIAPDDLIKAVKKAANISFNDQNKNLENYHESNGQSSKGKILLNDSKNSYPVEPAEIIRCEAKSNYTLIYLTDDQKIVMSKTLKYFDQLLPKDIFFRSHQSHLINLMHLEKFSKQDGGELLLKNGHRIPLASRRKEEFLKIFQNF